MTADHLVQPADGRIVTVGTARGDGDGVIYVRRYNADGMPDAAFGAGGAVRIDNPGTNDTAAAVALAPDGRLVVLGYAGEDTLVARLLPDGRPDPAFDGDGLKTFNVTVNYENPRAVMVGADGRITFVVNVQYNELYLGRLNADGSADLGFGSQGAVRQVPGGFEGSALAPLAGGQFLLAGAAGPYYTSLGVCRFNANGTLDATFGTNGVAAFKPTGSSSEVEANAIAVQPDGKIILAGRSGLYSYELSYDATAIARFNADGSVDATFATAGGRIISGAGAAVSVAVVPDGRVALATRTIDSAAPPYTRVLLLTATGQDDASFDGDGRLDPALPPSGLGGRVISVSAPQGKLLVAGTDAARGAALARFRLDGQLDATFGSGGRVAVPAAAGGADEGRAMLPLPDGRVLVAGTTAADRYALYRLRADGSVDPTFGTGGRVTLPLFPNDLALGAGGRVYVGGMAPDNAYGSRPAVARLLDDGRPDPAWGTAGFATGPNVNGLAGDVLATDAAGGAYLAGTNYNGVGNVVHFRPDGSLDQAFGGGTTAGGDAGYFWRRTTEVNDVAVDAAGRVVLAARADGDFTVLRLTTAGTLDPAFGAAGVRTVVINGFVTSEADSLALRPDGSAVVLGRVASTQWSIVRLTPAGALDATFDGDGYALLGESAKPYALALQADGKVVAMGAESGWLVMARLRPDGSFDVGFTPGSGVQRVVPPVGGPMYPSPNGLSLGIDGQGRLLVGGTAQTGSGGRDFFVTRLLGDSYRTDAGGPYAVTEGGSLQLSASAQPNPGASVVKWEWDLDYDGSTFTADALGQNTTVHFGDADGPSQRRVVVRATDSNGLVSLAEATVAVSNAAPSAAAFGGGEVDAGSAATVSFSSVTDPSPADVSAGLRYSFDFDADGTFEVVNSPVAAATVPAGYLPVPGTRTVRGRVTDKDGGFADYGAAVVVRPAAATGPGTTLSPLRAAADAYVKAGTSAAVNYGASGTLEVKKSDSLDLNRETYLRFDLSGVPSVSSATLRLFGKLSELNKDVDVQVFGSPDVSWAESGTGGITWNTRPATDAAPLATARLNGTAAAWYAWDVSEYLKQLKAAGAAAVTLVLRGAAVVTPSASFNSDEAADAATRPQLLVTTAATGPAAPPAVAQVHLGSARWAPAFRGALPRGAGDLPSAGFLAWSYYGGYAAADGPLPWNNLNEITVRFSEPVLVDAGDLRVRGGSGGGAEYAVSQFRYDPATLAATWTLASPLTRPERLSLSFPAGAATDLAGNALPATSFAVNVLPGDANRDGRVNLVDWMAVRSRVALSLANPIAGSRTYSPFMDVDGDGRTGAFDLAAVRARYSTVLPPAPLSAADMVARKPSGVVAAVLGDGNGLESAVTSPTSGEQQ